MSKNRTLHPHHLEGRYKFELIRSTRPSQRGSRQTFERVSEPFSYKFGMGRWFDAGLLYRISSAIAFLTKLFLCSHKTGIDKDPAASRGDWLASFA